MKEVGTSILLLPSRNIEESVEVVIPRMLSREYVDTTEENERRRHISRFPKYMKCGDIKIFSQETPDKIALQMIDRLKKIGFNF